MIKSIVLLLFFVIPLREVENVKISFPAHLQQEQIFFNYTNDNFSQQLRRTNGRLTAELKSVNYIHLNLNFRVVLNKSLLAELDQNTKELVNSLFNESVSFDEYFKNVSIFLEKNVKYTEKNLPQDTASVLLNRKANCVGLANLTKFLLDCVGIKNTFARGFYLKKQGKHTFIPVPHKWVEIHLANGVRFFYDPQRQRFSSNYILTRYDTDFTKIKKFKVLLIEKRKQVLN